MKQNASGKGNKGLEIFELKKHMKNHHQHVRNAEPSFQTTEKCLPVTLSIQQATKRLQERRLAAKNELLMRRLHDIYAEDSAAAWKNDHKIHIKIDRMHDRLVRWKGQVGAESRKRTEDHARAVSRELKQHCAKVTSPYTQAPFLRDYERSTKAFDAAKNHAYLTALHLFNNNAYDARVKKGTLAARSEGIRARSCKSKGETDASTPRFDKPEHRRLTGRVANYEANPRPSTAPIGQRRPQGFDPNSKLIRNLHKDIERAKKKEAISAADDEDGYNTPDEDMHDHEKNAARTDGNHTTGRNRSASPPRRVYEELSDAFGFKKRYFSDDMTKSEHHWNRHQCSSPAVLATREKKEIIPLDDRVCKAISKRKGELRSPIRDWHINEKFAESQRSPLAQRTQTDAGRDTTDNMREYYDEDRSEAEEKEEQGDNAADQYLQNLMASLEQEEDDEAQWTGGYSPFPSFNKEGDSLIDAHSVEKSQSASNGNKPAANNGSVDESSTIASAQKSPAVVLHRCGYTLQGVVVESLLGDSGRRSSGDCVLPTRKELLAECEVNARCKLTSEDMSEGSVDTAVVEALVRDTYIMSIFDVGYSVTNNELFNRGNKKGHISFKVEDYIKRQQEEIQKLDKDLNHLKSMQVSESAVDANTSPGGSVFQSTFEAEAIEDGSITPCSTGVLIELTSGVSLSKDVIGSLYIPLGSLKTTLLSMSSEKSSSRKKKTSKTKHDSSDDVQTLLRKLNRFSAIGKCTTCGSDDDAIQTDLFTSLADGLDAAGEALLTSMLVRTFQPIFTTVEACSATTLNEAYALKLKQLVETADSEKKASAKKIAIELRKGIVITEHAAIQSAAVSVKAYELSIYNIHTL